jgi:hypothetical protein
MTFKTLLEERGFPNARPLTRIVENGTFVRNLGLTPFLGMGPAIRGCRDRASGASTGFPPELRLPKLEDEPRRRITTCATIPIS